MASVLSRVDTLSAKIAKLKQVIHVDATKRVSDLIQEAIAQHIASPRVISYAPSKLNEVRGQFMAANRVYDFVLNKSGVNFIPASISANRRDSSRLDAAKKKQIGKDRCTDGRSYQCGKICLGNRRKCHKGVRDVNDARRYASILASTNTWLKVSVSGDVSEKALARGKALFEARGNRVRNGKMF